MGPQIGIQKGPLCFAFWTISGRAVGAGRGCGDGASAGWCVIVSPALEAPAVIAGFDDVAVVSEAIEQRSGHFGITEDAWPFAERARRRRAPIPGSSEAERPARAAWSALRLLATSAFLFSELLL